MLFSIPPLFCLFVCFDSVSFRYFLSFFPFVFLIKWSKQYKYVQQTLKSIIVSKMMKETQYNKVLKTEMYNYYMAETAPGFININTMKFIKHIYHLSLN